MRTVELVAAGTAALIVLGVGHAGAEPLGVPWVTVPGVRQALADLRDELPDWAGRFRLSGNADGSVLVGDRNSPAPSARAFADNARLFLDVDVVDWNRVAEASVFVEWDAVLEGEVPNRVGSLYLRLDRLGGLDALNLKIGRMLIPYGEEYVRFSIDRPQNPLTTFSAAAPYGWDDGVLLFGPIPGTPVQYAAAVMTNSPDLDPRTTGQPALVGKLMWRPNTWAYLSVSGLRSGTLGSPGHPEDASLEFAETEIVAFGDEAKVPSYADGRMLAQDPSGRVSLLTGELDAIFTPDAWTRLWLAVGYADVHGGASQYNRGLTYATAEAILGLGRLSPRLDPFYLAVRWSTVGTFDANRGYRIDALNGGNDLGFNTRSVDVVSVGLGFRVLEHLILKAEYSWYDFSLVRGVPDTLRAAAEDRSYFGVGASVCF
jgi:hypothetical protein